MSNSWNSLITNYIKDFASRSTIDFKWYRQAVHSKACLLTMIDLKSARNVPISYMTFADKVLTEYDFIYQRIGMRFLKSAYDNKLLDAYLLHKIPEDNPEFTNLYASVMLDFHNDLARNVEYEKVNTIFHHLDYLESANYVYCWNFIRVAKDNNLIDKLIEELYLLKEIAAFQNRKGE